MRVLAFWNIPVRLPKANFKMSSENCNIAIANYIEKPLKKHIISGQYKEFMRIRVFNDTCTYCSGHVTSKRQPRHRKMSPFLSFVINIHRNNIAQISLIYIFFYTTNGLSTTNPQYLLLLFELISYLVKFSRTHTLKKIEPLKVDDFL